MTADSLINEGDPSSDIKYSKLQDGNTSNDHNGIAKSNDDSSSDSSGCLDTYRRFPKSVFFILGNEFCERFSYFGMRTVLTLYLTNALKFSETNSVALYHGFIVLCYFMPLFGSILADAFIGRFHTILWVSLIYACGNVLLAVASAFQSGVHPWMDILGLVIIAVGTGGIKPCVSAFGGDQFAKGEERLLQTFFSVFYFSINAGSTISVFVTPIIRTIPCLGQQTCYPVAFGLPAALMVLACVSFAAGSFWYKKYPPSGNVLVDVVAYIFRALRNKFRARNDKNAATRAHWLDHCLDGHDCKTDKRCQQQKDGKCYQEQFVKDTRAFLRVCGMFLPLPIYWALSDQQGSRWILQATYMDGIIGNGFELVPDQMQLVNPIVIMALIPVFEFWVYPLVGKCVKVTPLRKMALGGFLAAAAFVIAGFLQIAVQTTYPIIPAKGFVDVGLLNMNGFNISMNISGVQADIPANGSHIFRNIPCPAEICQPFSEYNEMNLTAANAYSGYIQDDKIVLAKNDMVKSHTGFGEFKIRFLTVDPKSQWTTVNQTIYLCMLDRHDGKCHLGSLDDNVKHQQAMFSNDGISKIFELRPGSWGVFLPKANLTDFLNPDITFKIHVQGGIYTAAIYKTDNKAPPSMKSVLSAVWLLSIAFGNLIVLIVAESRLISNEALEYFFFAGLMGAVVLLFSLMAHFWYEYVYYIQDDENLEKKSNGIEESSSAADVRDNSEQNNPIAETAKNK